MNPVPFLASPAGRWTRVGLGAVLLAVGAVLGGGGYVLAGFGVVMAGRALADVCLLASTIGKPLRGSSKAVAA